MAENENLKNVNRKFEKKLDFTRKVTEQKILESISNDSYREDPHLITVLSTTLNEDEIDLDEDSETDGERGEITERSRKGKFLQKVEDQLDKASEIQIERLEHLKEKVIDHLKVTKTRKNRSRTDSKRKERHEDDEEQQSSRPRTVSPSQ